MMYKVVQSQTKSISAAVCVKSYDFAKRLQLFGLSIRSQAHHLVLIAEFLEAEVLRHRCVRQPYRMGESHGARDLHAACFTDTPHGACEIAKPVGGEQRCSFERRNKKCARQVRFVVLDTM